MYREFSHQKWKLSDKNYGSSHIAAQNIACGGSNEYPQSMF